MTEQQVQELREKIVRQIPLSKSMGVGITLNPEQAKYLLNALDENKALKEGVDNLETLLKSFNEHFEKWGGSCKMEMHERFILARDLNYLLNTKTDKQ